MSDETPQADGEPTEAAPAEPAPAPDAEAPAPDAEAPTVAEAPATAQPPAKVDEDDVVPVPAAAGASTAHDRPGIFVPKWVGLVAAAIVAALVFGGIGYAIGQSNDDSNRQSASSSRNFPGATGNGRIPNFGGGNSNNGNGNSNGNSNGSGQTPSNPFGGNGNSNGGSGSGSGSGGSTTTGNGGFLGVAIENADNGAQVTTVQSGSAAATAGLKTGDVITAVDGTTVDSASALAGIVQQHSSGDTITVTYTRNGQSATAKVTLGSRSSTGTPS